MRETTIQIESKRKRGRERERDIDRWIDILIDT